MLVISVFVFGTAISLFRILVSNRDALSNLVWAEDGLFPLCIQGNGYFQCLIEPYEGYFLFLSRTLALPVAVFPQSSWPLVTNIVAAVAFGFLSSVITWLLLRAQLSKTIAIGAGLAAVLLPIVGLEAINTSGSAYMLLLVVAAICVSFPFTPRLPLFLVPLILFVTALTIPSSVVLFIPLLVALVFGWAQEKKQTITNIAGLSLGLVIQFFVVLTAENSRSVEITPASIQDWLAQFPKAMLTLLPGFADIGERGQLADSVYSPNLWTGFFAVLLLCILSAYLLSRKSPQLKGAGWLLITGYLIGLIPAVTNYPINRYFVVPIITLVIALFIWIGSVFTGKYSIIPVIVIILIFLAWLQDFGASEIRTTPSPSWPDMLSTLQEQCKQDPDSPPAFTFSPNWPFADANFTGPTSHIVNCRIILTD